MSEKEPLVTQEQPLKGKWIPILWDGEKRELLEKLPISELFLREEIIKNELADSQKKDRQRFIDLGGNILQRNSVSEWALQLNEELKMIDTIINERSRTIEDAANDSSISYDSNDILELYKLVASDSTTTDSRAAYESLKWHIDIAKSGIQRWWTLDDILEKLKIPKDNRKYWKIVAKAFIGEQLDSAETSAVVANTTFDVFKRGIEELSPTEKITFTSIYQRLSESDQLIVGEEGLIKLIGSWENYQQAKENISKELWVNITEDEYNMLVGSARKINTDASAATTRAQTNKDIQIAALEKWNLVEALQQEAKYQRETSQIEYYRDLRSSISKTEWNQINNISSQGNESMIVGSADFSKNLTEFMNDPTVSSIYPKLNDGTTIPIIKSGPDSCVVQGCEVPVDEVAWLVQLNEALAEKGLRFFSTKSPLTRILSNIEQTLRGKGIRNVPHFWDFKNIATYKNNIVDILYALIDPDPQKPAQNVNERIDLTSKRLKNGIPLIVHGRQSWIVKEDSSIDINKLTEKLTTLIQSGYPFLFWGDKKERG